MRTVFRYVVPVNDKAYEIELSGRIVHVETRAPEVVEFWAISSSDAEPVVRTFQVFGTGHPVPHSAIHIGTTLAANGALVWHLFELLVGDAS